MSISLRHVLQQGPVLRSLVGVAAAAVGQKLRKPSGELELPGPWLRETIPSRSPQLVVDYIQWTGGDFARYDENLPPHLFPHWGFPLMAQTLRGLPYPLTGVLNQGCSLTQRAPLPKDRPLQLQARLEGIDDNGQRARIHQRLLTGTSDEPEALVSDVYAVVKLRSGDKSKKREKPQVPEAAQAIKSWDVGPKAGLDFALLTGDFNPIHWIRPAAKAAGFKSTILHGFASLALTIERLNAHLEDATWKQIDVRFTRPVLLPNTLTLHLDAPAEDGATPLYLTDQKGELCMVGSFTGA